MEVRKDIYESHNLYPFSGKIKDHFAGNYDEVLIVFLPFYDQQLKEGISEKEIFQTVKTLSWETVRADVGFQDLSELYKALKTSIGSLRPIFAQPELAVQLHDHIERSGIQAPVEGAYDTFSKVAIYTIFQLLGKQRVVVTDEFYESTYTLDLSGLDAISFSERIAGDAYFIYPEDKRFLFTMEWDSFFFLIASGKEDMSTIQSTKLFEGFLCTAFTEHDWYYAEGEKQTLLMEEKKQEGKIQFKIKRLLQGFIDRIAGR
jgi:hypothetical protein